MKNANLLLYLNLAGEVFYIIVHRMKSQKVKEEHQERVRNDIAIAICHTTVIQNLLKSSLQILNLKLADVRILMDRIVHSSIMTVNAFSMEKLFELTLIATKYQYTTCQYPSDILLIALNHLDTMRKSVTDSTARTLAENLHNLMVDRFKDVDVQTMQTYRYLVLSYLADVKLKMTNLIRLGLQKTSGEFVKEFPDKVKRAELRLPGWIQIFKSSDYDETNEIPCISGCRSICHCDGFDMDETIKALSTVPDKKRIQIHESVSKSNGAITSSKFLHETSESDSGHVLKSSFALNGDRGVSLGMSIYDIPGNCDDVSIQNDDSEKESENPKPTYASNDQRGAKTKKSSSHDMQCFSENPDFYATKGLDLCSVLLGCDPGDSSSSTMSHASCVEFGTSSHNPVSASALGLESVLEHFPSMGFATSSTKSEGNNHNQLSKDPSSVDIIKFDARSELTEKKAALVAIAQDLFDLEAEEKGLESGSKYKSTLDELLGNFDFPEDDE